MHTLIKCAALSLAATICAATTAAANDQRAAMVENFTEADANGDTALTMEEFTRLIDLNAADNLGRARLVQRTGRYSTAFGRLDANKDGIIDSDEIAAMAAQAQQ